MATTRVTTTRDGASAIDYASQQGSPHDSNNPNVSKRVLRLNSYNCSLQLFKDQMQAVWTANHTKQRKRIELYRITQSFGSDELDINDTDNLESNLDLANKAGMALAKKLYPDRQFIVSTQADGKGHKIHNHIDVVNPDYLTGKAIRGKRTRQGYIAQVSDEVCNDLGIKMSKNLNPVKDGAYNTRSNKTVNKNRQRQSKTGQKSYLEQIQDTISKVTSDSSVYTTDQFVTKCKSLGVDVKFRKRKSGTITGVSYKLDNSDMKRAVRGTRLGTNFQSDYVIQMIRSHEKELDDKRIKDIQTNQRQVNTEVNIDKPVETVPVKPHKDIHKSVQKTANQKVSDELDKLSEDSSKVSKNVQNDPKNDSKSDNVKYNNLMNELTVDIELKDWLNKFQVKDNTGSKHHSKQKDK